MALLTRYDITVPADGFPGVSDFFALVPVIAPADEPNVTVFLNGLLLTYGVSYQFASVGTQLEYFNVAGGHILKAGDLFTLYY